MLPVLTVTFVCESCIPAAAPGSRQLARAYAEGVTRAAPEVHDSLRVLRSRSAALWFCGASLVAGFGIFYFAVVSHEW